MPQIDYTSFSHEELYNIMYNAAKEGSYTAYVRGKRCKSETTFFREISASLQFPWYFGENWAAFDECICDLEWLCFERILIVIDDFSVVFNNDCEAQKKLIKYLCCAVDYWQSEGICIKVMLNN